MWRPDAASFDRESRKIQGVSRAGRRVQSRGGKLLDRQDAGRLRAAMQPVMQALHRACDSIGDDLDRSIRPIARYSTNAEALGLEPRTMAKKNALDLAGDQETSNDPLQGNLDG